MSTAAYFAPALMLVVGTIGVMLWSAQTRARKTQMVGTMDSQAPMYQKKFLSDEAYVTYVDYVSIGNVSHSVAAVNISLIILWGPFYTMNVVVPFCHGLCVPPTLWSASLWLGLTSAVVSPLLLTIDLEVREQVRDMWANCCCCCCGTPSGKPHYKSRPHHSQVAYTPATIKPASAQKWRFNGSAPSDMDSSFKYNNGGYGGSNGGYGGSNGGYGGSTTSYGSASDVELIQPYAEFYGDPQN